MIQHLINKTNNPDFYQNCDLKTESYSVNLKKRTSEIILSINQASYDEPVEYEEWRIKCLETEKIHGFDFDTMMPNVMMKILDKHPLLWKYHNDELECEVKGTPVDINKFVVDLVKLLEKQAGNWVDLKDVKWNFSYYMFKISNTIIIPASLEEGVRHICTEQGLSFKLKNYSSGKEKGHAHKPNSKILMFGNVDVSPYEFNRWQPYVIAETFEAERIK